MPVTASVILPSKNEQHYLKMTVDSFLKAKNKASFEIIVVDDASVDKSSDFIKNEPYRSRVRLFKTSGLGTANARNFGANYAEGEFLIFADAHVTVPDSWLDFLLEGFSFTDADLLAPAMASINNPRAVGYGLSLNQDLEVYWHTEKPDGPQEVAVLPGGFLAVKKQVFERIGGFDRNFRIWGYDDVEISMKAWLFGYKCMVYPEVTVKHLFRSPHPYKVDFSHINFNLFWMALSHFNEKRVEKTLKKILRTPNMEGVIREVIFSNVWQQRKNYFRYRAYDDDWYFKYFRIPF